MNTALPIDLGLTLLALGIALWLRPWRGVADAGPPWPWLGLWAVMPLLWGIDRYLQVAIAQPMSGAVLLMLMAGWPLAVLALLPVALFTMLAGQLGWADGLHRLVWLGLVPATLALGGGALVRRWLPRHLFVYILGRGFFVTFLASAVSGTLALTLLPPMGEAALHDLLVVRPIAAFGEATLTGMLTAILVAFRPAWLATYSDRLYLPR